nr:MAG TPA: hypothetical protein [Bacteriophage sp.]
MSQARNINHFFCLHPFSLFGDRSRSVIRTFLYNTHVFYFV